MYHHPPGSYLITLVAVLWGGVGAVMMFCEETGPTLYSNIQLKAEPRTAHWELRILIRDRLDHITENLNIS